MEASPPPERTTVLYDRQRRRSPQAKFAPFAGYRMPLWFSSIAEEHHATRTAATLFDCGHMGVIDIAGPAARAYLQQLTTNNLNKITPGHAQYSFLSDPQGRLIDDIIVYHLANERLWLICNASNKQQVWKHLNAPPKLAGQGAQPKLVFLSDAPQDTPPMTLLALQGPMSGQVLAQVLRGDEPEACLKGMTAFGVCPFDSEFGTLMLTRTGYTGSREGYEIIVSVEQAPALWERLLSNGEPLGVKPAGLAARDSLRIEAGLPLFGHELQGDLNVSPFEAGYPWAVDLAKDDFLGKDALVQQKANQQNEIVRLQWPGRGGIRPVRPHDAVLDAQGCCIGWITSAAKVQEHQIALAYVARGRFAPQQPVGLFYVARTQKQRDQGLPEHANMGETFPADLQGDVLKRFAKF